MKKYSNRRVSLAVFLSIALIAASLLTAPKLFISKANGRPQVNDKKGLNNYDIRLDSKAADKMAELRGRSGRSAVNVADVRHTLARGESALKQHIPSSKVEYGERLHTPEIIGIAVGQTSHASLVGQAHSSKAESLRAFAK